MSIDDFDSETEKILRSNLYCYFDAVVATSRAQRGNVSTKRDLAQVAGTHYAALSALNSSDVVMPCLDTLLKWFNASGKFRGNPYNWRDNIYFGSIPIWNPTGIKASRTKALPSPSILGELFWSEIDALGISWHDLYLAYRNCEPIPISKKGVNEESSVRALTGYLLYDGVNKKRMPNILVVMKLCHILVIPFDEAMNRLEQMYFYA